MPTEQDGLINPSVLPATLERYGAVLALLNMCLYLFSIAWRLLGVLGIWWSRALNETLVGEAVFALFWLTSIGLGIPALVRQALNPTSTRPDRFAILAWTTLWLLDVFWLQQFYVTK